MATLSEWSNYDYNGAIFVFGRIDNSVTTHWSSVTKVMMSVDSPSNYVYSSEIKNIPYTQTTKIDGGDCVNNTACKVFNINTYTHRTSNETPYQFSAGTHTCYLQFYYSEINYVSTTVSVQVHCSLTTPTVSVDGDSGIITVNRSTTNSSARYYIEIRRKNRDMINKDISWQDKDYIHTVVMKGIEGGKYNEGIPHTGFMSRSSDSIAGSSLLTHETTTSTAKEADADGDIALMSMTENEPTNVSANTDIDYISTDGEYCQYFKFTAASAGVYHFYQSSGAALQLWCSLYSDAQYKKYLTSDSGSGENNTFDLYYQMTAGQTVYIEIYDRSRNGNTVTLRIDTASSTPLKSWTPYQLDSKKTVVLSYYSSVAGYVTVYPGKKATGLSILNEDSENNNDGKTPYQITPVLSGYNNIIVRNSSSADITFWLTNTHADVDYQPYWRVNPITEFRACVVFDNEEIADKYGAICISQVEDALTKLSSIISETSGTSITFDIANKGVSKLYVGETKKADTSSGMYINSSSKKIVSSASKTLYYTEVSAGTIYRVSYNHDTLYYAKKTTASTNVTQVSDSSAMVWYENVGYNVGVDENTLVVHDNASSYYIMSNADFTLEKVLSLDDCSDKYNSAYSNKYNIVVRFGLDGTTWMGNQGIATSGRLKDGGNSADINGQGKWMNWLYLNSYYGVAWSYAIINIDTSDIFESLYHVIHEEIAQSLGIGDDCYSHEESIHWDPEYANPDWYTGIDKTILAFAYNSNKNGYTQFDLCNDYDLPITLFCEYADRTNANTFLFRLKDAAGNWLLRSGEYEIYAWCTLPGTSGGSIAGSGSDGWDDDPYSLRSAPIELSIESGWYWTDYGIDMKSGLSVGSVPYTVWNEFVDAVAEVMGSGTLPDRTDDYGSAANLSFADGIQKAKASEDNKTFYAQRFNIINYIINAVIKTGIGVKKSLTSQVLAEDMIKLQDCRNLM